MHIINYISESIFGELWERFKKPWCTSFTIHFLFYTVFIGGLGVFASLFQFINNKGDLWSITENMITYSLALAIPTIVPILLSFNDTKNKSSLAQVSPIVCIVLPILLTFISYYYKISWPAFICIVISWIVWVISQYDNRCLNDKTFGEDIEANSRNKHGKSWNN